MKPFEYIKRTYGVNPSIGQRVKVDGDLGTIKEDRGHYLGVHFDGHKPDVIMNCHPTWKVEYMEEQK